MNGTEAGPLGKISASEGKKLYQEGVEALAAGNHGAAIKSMKGAVELDRRPLYLSHLGLCLAQYNSEFYASVLLCQEAVKKDPKNSVHFFRLGKVQRLAGRKKEAIRIFQLGLRIEKNPEIVAELKALGTRKKPVLPFLSRAHPLNKYLGKLRMNLNKGR
ncbi:tetratricopeptide repeat protein [Geomonas sp. RF6]|uniref:tetratricopeptide repeat protein n=1 Tax=Geomonas sp. RF6 TaxID=2897342 RepID=UPI001E43CEA3|nr:tetratricopeptide repeat protein [Geomonas sp. RF6]UFS71581.1 tetratricopeptide repeat protein [Geomonas sp. RF6]